jgi:predicted adenylyl cyclase CyaB
MINSQQYYTIREAADLLNVHWQTIRNNIKSGNLNAIKIGKTVRIPAQSLSDLQNISVSQTPRKNEIELRYWIKDGFDVEQRLREIGCKLTNHSHVIDHYYCERRIKNLEEKNAFYENSSGYAIRIRQIDNDYTGKLMQTMEVKKLAGPTYKDHSNCIEAEIDISSFDDTERLILMLDQKKFCVVDKERFVYRLVDVKFCIDSIKDFGTGLEIEKMSTKEAGIIKKELSKLAKLIGLKHLKEADKSLTYEIIRDRSNFRVQGRLP